MNRGSSGGSWGLRMRKSAGFNEAPIHESGKCQTCDSSSLLDCTSRFNEAPIHESGKSCQLLKMAGRSRNSRFNEAPIHESGKSSDVHASLQHVGNSLQ